MEKQNKKIYFLLNSVADAHSLRRIAEFKAAGAEVKAFGFLRSAESKDVAEATILGTFSNSLSYPKRLNIYRRAIKELFRQYKDKDITWYYLGLDVAMFATYYGRGRNYIYEECDIVHASIKNRFLFSCFEKLDKRIISRAKATVFTSEGFKEFHYPDGNLPSHIIMSENKLPADIMQYQAAAHHSYDVQHLRFAFIGGIRYKSLLTLASTIASNFPNHEFHFYGFVSPTFKDSELPKMENIFYHGRFQSPQDLPAIYEKTDVVVATYDVENLNVRYAEPNKLYEAIYFNCPIIVSAGTFLSRKVEQLGIGYSVDVNNQKEVIQLVQRVEKEITQKSEAIHQMDKSYAVDQATLASDVINLI